MAWRNNYLFSNRSIPLVGITSPKFKTPIIDHKEGEGIFINPKSMLRMRIEKAEVPWVEL